MSMSLNWLMCTGCGLKILTSTFYVGKSHKNCPRGSSSRGIWQRLEGEGCNIWALI